MVNIDEGICSDGRGALISLDPANVKTWTIATGKAALAGVSGTGTISLVESLEAIPEARYMSAVLAPGRQ